MGDQYDHLFKLLLVGDSNVGKTLTLLQFTGGEFKETKNTVGVDLKVKMVNYRRKKIKLTIWDTAGQERFRTLTSSYYRGAHGIVLMYDVTNRASFENVTEWLKEIDVYSTNEAAVKILIGNKIDKESQRQITRAEGIEFARDHRMLFIETSAKTKQGVQQAFDELILKMLDIPSLLEGEDFNRGGRGGVNVSNANSSEQGQFCCG